MKVKVGQLRRVVKEEMSSMTQARPKGGGRASLGFAIPEDSPDYGVPAPKAGKKKKGYDPKKWAHEAAADLGINLGRALAEVDLKAAVQATIDEAQSQLKHANAPAMDPWELSQAFVQNTDTLVNEVMKYLQQEIKEKVQYAVYDLGDAVDGMVGKPKAPPGQ